MGWRKEGGEDSGLLAGSEDEISNFAHRPFAAFFRADMRRESVSRLCDFSPFGGLVKIIGGLQVHPELSGCSQRLGQIQSRISRHVPFALDQLIQTSSGPAEFLGKGRLCHARRLQKLFVKNFPWMKGVSGLFHGLTSICSSNGNQGSEHRTRLISARMSMRRHSSRKAGGNSRLECGACR